MHKEESSHTELAGLLFQKETRKRHWKAGSEESVDEREEEQRSWAVFLFVSLVCVAVR